MSVNPNQIVGTFFRAGTRLIGIIHTPTFQGRMVFGPDVRAEGRLIASINGWTAGFAELVSAEGEFRPKAKTSGSPCRCIPASCRRQSAWSWPQKTESGS